MGWLTRKRLWYSLAILIGVPLAGSAAVLGIVRWERSQDEAVLARLEALGGHGGISGRHWIFIHFYSGFSDELLQRAVTIGGTRIYDLGLNLATITNTGAVALKTASRVERLSVAWTQIDDAAMAHLATLEHLKSLNLKGTKVRGPGLRYLTGLKNLEGLGLGHTLVDDSSLDVLATMPQLRELSLAGTRVTAEGLLKLRMLSKLEDLLVSDIRITEDQYERLVAVLPWGCEIRWDRPKKTDKSNSENGSIAL